MKSLRGWENKRPKPARGRQDETRTNCIEFQTGERIPILYEDRAVLAIDKPLGLRAVSVAYGDPFTKRRVQIRAPVEDFVREYGIDIPQL